MNPSLQVSADAANFAAAASESSASAPYTKAMASKTEQAAREAKQEKISMKQLEQMEKLSVETRATDEADAKASLMRKINAYQRDFKERLGGLKPMAKGAELKATAEELKMHLSDIEYELGKQGGYDIARYGFIEGMKKIEEFNAKYGYIKKNLTGFGTLAEQFVTARQVEDPNTGDIKIMEGPMTPTLKEFVIKYDDWFSTRVEVRMLIQVIEMMNVCDRINSGELKQQFAAAQTKPASSAAAAKAKKL